MIGSTPLNPRDPATAILDPPGPTQAGGNGQVVTAPDGCPISTFDVQPGRVHDTTAVRGHTETGALLLVQ